MIFDKFFIEEDAAERFVAYFRRTNGLTISFGLIEGIIGAFMFYLAYLSSIAFAIFGLVCCVGVFLAIVGKLKYWKRLIIDSTNKSILVEGHYPTGLFAHKIVSTTFDGIENIIIRREANANTIRVIPHEGAVLLAALCISENQANLLKAQFEKRMGIINGQVTIDRNP